MPQDLSQEWTGSTRFRKSWEVLSESENREHRETCSSDIEHTQPPAGDDLSLDENRGILDLRPNSQQGKRWNLSDREDQCEILFLIRKKRPKLVIGCVMPHIGISASRFSVAGRVNMDGPFCNEDMNAWML